MPPVLTSDDGSSDDHDLAETCQIDQVNINDEFRYIRLAEMFAGNRILHLQNEYTQYGLQKNRLMLKKQWPSSLKWNLKEMDTDNIQEHYQKTEEDREYMENLMMFCEHNDINPDSLDIFKKLFFNSINHEHGGFTQIYGAKYIKIRDMRTEMNE